MFVLQHGDGMADVRTPAHSTHTDNIRAIFGAAVAR